MKLIGQDPPTSVNLCEATEISEDMVINYTYKDQGRQMMILDLGAPVSVAGIPWMKQYLAGFGDRKFKRCTMQSTFCFWPKQKIY